MTSNSCDGAAQTYPTTACSFGGAGVTPTCAPAQRRCDACTLMRVVKDSVTGGSNDGHLCLDVRLSCLRAHRRPRAIGILVEPILTTRSDSLDQRSPSVCRSDKSILEPQVRVASRRIPNNSVRPLFLQARPRYRHRQAGRETNANAVSGITSACRRPRPAER